jgi:superfamily II DNA/RNA helicase
LEIILKVTSDSKLWIAQQLKEQPKHQKAIVFCLFKRNVSDMAKFLKVQLENRQVLECVSGSLGDLPTFRTQDSAVMVCTSVLCAGVSIDGITRVFFLDGVQGPEALLQGAGRGAREERDKCFAALVTTKGNLQYFQQAKLSGVSDMATFCQKCIDEGADFTREVCSLFEHPNGSNSVKRKLAAEDDGAAAVQTDNPKVHFHSESYTL